MKLIIENYNKSYGTNKIFNNVNFEFVNGKIYGLLGRNGSGKTTLFNSLDSLIDYESGNFYIENDNGEKEVLSNNNLGFVLTDPMIPEFLTGYEFIKTFMEINNINELDKIEEYFKMISLDKSDYDKLIKDYSMGMKNKIQILMCLILKPKVILLDEPLTSFDVIVAKEIKDMIKSLKKEHIIIFSTHILELATNLCDEIVVVNNKSLQLIDHNIINSKSFEKDIVEILKDEN